MRVARDKEIKSLRMKSRKKKKHIRAALSGVPTAGTPLNRRRELDCLQQPKNLLISIKYILKLIILFYYIRFQTDLYVNII